MIRPEQVAVMFYIGGLTRKRVAERLHIGEETVKTYLQRFRDSHGLTSRQDVMTWYRENPPQSPNQHA
jgi:DNA-binding NarL/FixJ family response regulator